MCGVPISASLGYNARADALESANRAGLEERAGCAGSAAALRGRRTATSRIATAPFAVRRLRYARVWAASGTRKSRPRPRTPTSTFPSSLRRRRRRPFRPRLPCGVFCLRPRGRTTAATNPSPPPRLLTDASRMRAAASSSRGAGALGGDGEDDDGRREFHATATVATVCEGFSKPLQDSTANSRRRRAPW